MKLRWSCKNFKCKCGKQVKIGELAYTCKCCDNNVCKECGDPVRRLDNIDFTTINVVKNYIDIFSDVLDEYSCFITDVEDLYTENERLQDLVDEAGLED